VKRKSTSDRETTVHGREPAHKRPARMASELGDDAGSPMEEVRPPAHSTRSQSSLPAARVRSATDSSEARPRPPVTEFEVTRTGPGPTAGPTPRRTLANAATPMVLPARKVFPIQIGDKLFRLSGASISSDGEFGSVLESRYDKTR